MELNISKADGSLPKFLSQLAKVELLVIDDWGLAPLSSEECRDFLDIIDDRVNARSTIIGEVPVNTQENMNGPVGLIFRIPAISFQFPVHETAPQQFKQGFTAVCVGDNDVRVFFRSILKHYPNRLAAPGDNLLNFAAVVDFPSQCLVAVGDGIGKLFRCSYRPGNIAYCPITVSCR
ncbi:MAG TPA: hypothetical protein DCQ14_00395 [Firmicutes bacterium]|nr:hypothetical protein [Bacillota bacterium]